MFLSLLGTEYVKRVRMSGGRKGCMRHRCRLVAVECVSATKGMWYDNVATYSPPLLREVVHVAVCCMEDFG